MSNLAAESVKPVGKLFETKEIFFHSSYLDVNRWGNIISFD